MHAVPWVTWTVFGWTESDAVPTRATTDPQQLTARRKHAVAHDPMFASWTASSTELRAGRAEVRHRIADHLIADHLTADHLREGHTS
ncbi:hypothetical protein ACFV0R_00205 [Streptomyces sp. NPDC059578]|uniref:hypothetical protein n=1 Tax=unclassified Streptomyces TaxID=2593676 RepID=UPI0036519BFC